MKAERGKWTWQTRQKQRLPLQERLKKGGARYKGPLMRRNTGVIAPAGTCVAGERQHGTEKADNVAPLMFLPDHAPAVRTYGWLPIGLQRFLVFVVWKPSHHRDRRTPVAIQRVKQTGGHEKSSGAYVAPPGRYAEVGRHIPPPVAPPNATQRHLPPHYLQQQPCGPCFVDQFSSGNKHVCK